MDTDTTWRKTFVIRQLKCGGNAKLRNRMEKELEPNKEAGIEPCVIQNAVECSIWKDKKHSHFWIQDGVLYESYSTIRGLRYRHRFPVDGLPDTDKCSESMMLYIKKQYVD